jgi:hypothetical protein
MKASVLAPERHPPQRLVLKVQNQLKTPSLPSKAMQGPRFLHRVGAEDNG